VVRDVVLWAESATEGVGAADDLTLVVAVFHGTASYVVTPTRTYEADVPPSLPVLARCTDEVRAFLGNAGLSADQTEQMVLGLHEVLANVIGHAHPTTPISVFIEVRDDHGFLNVEIVTRDDGRTFIEVPERPRGGERGRGLDMCRELFDVSEHLREGDKNVWVLARRFARAGGENRKENLLKEGIDG
jgi:anti-sigma regulatory factor (Ser/Thr protein kinase)